MSTTTETRKSSKSTSKLALPDLLPTDKHLLELSSAEDYKSIIKEVLDRVIMVEFFAHWCGPCKILTVKLNEIAEKYKGKLLIVKVDVDVFEDLATEHDVSAIPTFMIMKDKRVVEKFSDSNVKLLEETLEKVVGKPEEMESSATAGVEVTK